MTECEGDSINNYTWSTHFKQKSEHVLLMHTRQWLLSSSESQNPTLDSEARQLCQLCAGRQGHSYPASFHFPSVVPAFGFLLLLWSLLGILSPRESCSSPSCFSDGSNCVFLKSSLNTLKTHQQSFPPSSCSTPSIGPIAHSIIYCLFFPAGM